MDSCLRKNKKPEGVIDLMEISLRKVGLFVLFIIWVVVLSFVVRFFDIELVIEPITLLYALIIFFVIHAFWAWNWQSLNKAVGLKYDYWTLLKGTFIAGFTDSVTPRLMPSAELTTSYYLEQRFGGRLADYFPVVMLESNIIFVFQIVVFLIAALLFGGVMIRASVYIVVALFFVLLALVVAWQFKDKIIKDIFKLSLGNIKALNKSTGRIMDLVYDNPLLVLRVGLVNLCLLMLEASVVYVAIGQWDSFLIVLIAFMATRLITLVSMIPGGVGVYEISISAILGAGGIESGILLSAVIIYRSIFYWFNIFLGGYLTGSELYLWLTSLGSDRISKEFQEVKFNNTP